MVNLLEVESEDLGTEWESGVKEKQNLGKVYKAKIIPSLQAAEKILMRKLGIALSLLHLNM